MSHPRSIRIPILFILLTVFIAETHAEYRVYQYYVKSRYKLSYDQEGYLVTSTLDPVSYLAYHGGHEALKIDLLRTWLCPGHTGDGRPICSSPLEQLNQGD
jgi:hypothetical protein